MFTPLTPALSPLRGEGAATDSSSIRETYSTLRPERWPVQGNQVATNNQRTRSVIGFPSPLNGERARVGSGSFRLDPYLSL